MKYYDIQELRNHVYKIKEDIRSNVIKELNMKHGGEPKDHFPGIDVSVRFHHHNEIIDIFNKDIVCVTLENETPDVYQITGTHPVVSKDTPIIKVVFTIKSYATRNDDVLGLGDESHTFETYEKFLTFIGEKTHDYNLTSNEPFFVALRDRKSNIGIANIFGRKSNVRKDVPNIPGFSINMLSVYKNLADDIKEGIDKLLCPITISKGDVEERFDLDFINIYVDREDLVKSFFETDKWDLVIGDAFKASVRDIKDPKTE